nr:MAG TPA: hypothetical protein [Caudoviricetes sp.]
MTKKLCYNRCAVQPRGQCKKSKRAPFCVLRGVFFCRNFPHPVEALFTY